LVRLIVRKDEGVEQPFALRSRAKKIRAARRRLPKFDGFPERGGGVGMTLEKAVVSDRKPISLGNKLNPLWWLVGHDGWSAGIQR
jgi:hypothetical protein